MKLFLHSYGIYDNETRATLEGVTVKEMYLYDGNRDTFILCHRLHNKNPSF